MTTKKKEQAKVVSQEQLADGIFSLWIQTEAAGSARPGQFISMYTNDGSKLLPRPISICEIDKEGGKLRVVYRVTGEKTGTEEFSQMKAGDTIPVIGPLGNGFPFEKAEGKKVFLMGGGIGVPPILELAKQMKCEKKQIVVGYRDAHTFLKEEFEQAGEQQWEALCQEYETDSRTGVRNLTARYRKKQQALVQERERLEVMKTFERKYADYSFICGIDEAGRGPLAGPVVAGAVILPKDCEILYLNDSKKLSAAKREELYDEIMEKAVAAAVGMASPARIDEINILQATYEAMREAISKLAVEPGILLNDAVTIPEMIIPQVPIIKGDAKSVSIAAASILAKVTRDRLMVEYDKVMPEYGFAGHKGYGSKEHIEAIKKYGPTPIHRKTFIKKFI